MVFIVVALLSFTVFYMNYHNISMFSDMYYGNTVVNYYEINSVPHCLLWSLCYGCIVMTFGTILSF